VKSSRKYFSEVASRWDELRSGYFSESVRDKAISLSGARRGKLAVDVAAGTGYVTEGLVRAGLRVIAVDDSPEMLAEARRRVGSRRGVEFRLGSAEQLPLNAESADYIFANMLLHHTESPGAVLREMTRVLRPGGRVVATDLDKHGFAFLSTEQHDRWLGFDRAAVQGLFADAGLKGVKVVGLDEKCCATSTRGERADVSIFAAIGTKPTHKITK
jgi:ubiquinone/menaquinone biosynthesis C-methylase UbiE